MKILLTLAVTLAAFTSVPAAAANEPSGGHYEWQNRAVYGPKSNFPTRVRVWVEGAPEMASCDCAMMRDKATKAACMDMPKNGAGHSKG